MFLKVDCRDARDVRRRIRVGTGRVDVIHKIGGISRLCISDPTSGPDPERGGEESEPATIGDGRAAERTPVITLIGASSYQRRRSCGTKVEAHIPDAAGRLREHQLTTRLLNRGIHVLANTPRADVHYGGSGAIVGLDVLDGLDVRGRV